MKTAALHLLRGPFRRGGRGGTSSRRRNDAGGVPETVAGSGVAAARAIAAATAAAAARAESALPPMSTRTCDVDESTAALVAATAPLATGSGTRKGGVWTSEERSAYIASLAGTGPSSSAQVLRFLEDVLASTPLPSPWFAARDRHGRLFFGNATTGTTMWHHPLESVLLELGAACKDILELPAGVRSAHARSLHTKWQEQALGTFAKWTTSRDVSGLRYYYHSETGETMWQSPHEVLLPGYQMKIAAIRRLADPIYVASLEGIPNTHNSHSSASVPVTERLDVDMAIAPRMQVIHHMKEPQGFIDTQTVVEELRSFSEQLQTNLRGEIEAQHRQLREEFGALAAAQKEEVREVRRQVEETRAAEVEETRAAAPAALSAAQHAAVRKAAAAVQSQVSEVLAACGALQVTNDSLGISIQPAEPEAEDAPKPPQAEAARCAQIPVDLAPKRLGFSPELSRISELGSDDGCSEKRKAPADQILASPEGICHQPEEVVKHLLLVPRASPVIRSRRGCRPCGASKRSPMKTPQKLHRAGRCAEAGAPMAHSEAESWIGSAGCGRPVQQTERSPAGWGQYRRSRRLHTHGASPMQRLEERGRTLGRGVGTVCNGNIASHNRASLVDLGLPAQQLLTLGVPAQDREATQHKCEENVEQEVSSVLAGLEGPVKNLALVLSDTKVDKEMVDELKSRLDRTRGDLRASNSALRKELGTLNDSLAGLLSEREELRNQIRQA